MLLSLDYENALVGAIGDAGLAPGLISEFIENNAAVAESVEAERTDGAHAWRELPYDTEMVDVVHKKAMEVRDRFADFIVCGIGGSSLGARALVSALAHPYYNLLGERRGPSPRIFFAENPDPETLASLFDVVDPATACVNVVSKSGNTAETVANFTAIAGFLADAVGGKWAEHVVVTTGRDKGFLRQAAGREGFDTLDAPPDVGGRFSVLSPAALFPAAVCGIDVSNLTDGARLADEAMRGAPAENPAFVYAVLAHHANDAGRRVNVLMPYADCLYPTAMWFRQLWAESLGRKTDLAGDEVYAGQTPVAALGAVDQHSQIQLYTEGPNDKFVTFIDVHGFRREVELGRLFEDEDGADYLAGRRLVELLSAEKGGTEKALSAAGRPNVTFTLDSVKEESIGALLYTLMGATVYVAKFWNVDPYVQPGVEAGKVAAFSIMGRPGFSVGSSGKTQRIEARKKHVVGF